MNRCARVLPFCVGMLVFSSCTLGPKYSRPEFAIPEEFLAERSLRARLNKVALAASADDIEEQWWKGFEDPKLTELILEARESNARIAQSQAALLQSIARFQKTDAGDAISVLIAGESSLSNEREYDGGTERETTREGAGVLSLALPLDIFGRTRSAEEAASADVERARAELRGVLLSVSSEVAIAYVQLRGTEQQLELLRESVALQEKTLEIVRTRFESGLSPELDLRRAEASVETLRADIPPLEEQIVRSYQRLSTLVGQPQSVNLDSIGTSKRVPRYSNDLPQIIPIQVLFRRPDLQQAEAELKARMAEIGVAEAEWYPLVSLLGQLSIGRRGISGEPSISFLAASITGFLQQVIFDGGFRNAEIARAEAAAREALAVYRQTLLLAIEEIEGLLAGLQSSWERQRSLEKAVTASERSFFQAESLYRQGLTSFLDVVDAQRVLASAQQQLASAETSFAIRMASLFEVLGVEPSLRSDASDTIAS